jgi:hypothetical protein
MDAIFDWTEEMEGPGRQEREGGKVVEHELETGAETTSEMASEFLRSLHWLITSSALG